MAPGFAAPRAGGYRAAMTGQPTCRTGPRRLARALALVAALAATGCPHSRRHTLVPTVPTTGDAAARQRFLAAQAEFERTGGQVDEFEAIADAYHGDPVEPFALLYAGVAAHQSGQAAAAVDDLRKLLAMPALEPGLRARGRLYLGLASSYLGDADTALPMLDGADRAAENDDERTQWLAAQVHAHLASAVINWGPYYKKAVKDALDGTWSTGGVWWGVKEGAIDLVSISDKVPAEVKDKVAKVKAGLTDGSFAIWKGPIVGQDGKDVLAKDAVADDKFLSGINFYVKGVEGKIPSGN